MSGEVNNTMVLLSSGERVAYASMVTVMAVVTVVGNMLVCLTLRTFKMIGRPFLVSLAVSDILMGGVVMPSSALTLAMGGWPLGTTACHAVAFVKATALYASSLTLGVIAFDRYLSVRYVRFQMSRAQTAASLALSWLVSGLAAAGPFLGWGSYSMSPTKPVCTIDWMHSPSYTLACFAAFGILPQTFLSVCYLRIVAIVWRKKADLQLMRSEALRAVAPVGGNVGPAPPAGQPRYPHHQHRTYLSREEIGMLKTMVVVVLVCTVMVVPYMFLQLVSLSRRQEVWLRTETLTTSLFYLGSCLNPFIYSGGSRKFRHALLRLFARRRSAGVAPLRNAPTIRPNGQGIRAGRIHQLFSARS